MLLPRHQNAGQNRDIENSKEIVWKCVTVEIFGNCSNKSKLGSGGNKRSLNSGNACCHSVQNLFSSRVLYKDIKIRIHKNIILPLGCLGVKLGLWY
jgi:hypothetical protein